MSDDGASGEALSAGDGDVGGASSTSSDGDGTDDQFWAGTDDEPGESVPPGFGEGVTVDESDDEGPITTTLLRDLVPDIPPKVFWGIGAAAVIVGLLLLLSGTRIGLIGTGAVLLVSLYAVVRGIGELRRRKNTEPAYGRPPDRESTIDPPSAGTAIDESLESPIVRERRSRDSPVRTRLRDRIREAAVATVARVEGCSRSEAETRVADGSWIDDAEMAWFLGDESVVSGSSFRELARDRSLFYDAATGTIDHLYRLAVRREGDVAAGGGRLSRVTGGVRRRLSTWPPRRPAEDPVDPGTVRAERTNRWVGVAGVALLAAGIGLLAQRPVALLVGLVPIGYAALSRGAVAPEPEIAVERSLSETRVDPGDTVRVTLEVRNEGEGTLFDLRVIDGVPDELAVVEGTSRLATALRPGKRATFSYEVEAKRGAHEFEHPQVIAHDASCSVEVEFRIGEATTLECVPRLTEVDRPTLGSQATTHAGRVTTDSRGSGIEFDSLREYRRGDPMGRIDWNRHAKTGDLATVEFRQERAATVVFVIDARLESYWGTDEPAIEHCIAAARHLAASLLAGNDRVGVASFGPRFTWLSPGLGRTHRTQLRETLALGEGLSPSPPVDRFDPPTALARIRKRLPDDAQVVVCTPLVDAYAPVVPRRLAAAGHAVTVVSPDVTEDGTHGDRLAAVERTNRLHGLRRAGMHVLDWDPDRAFGAALADAERRWGP